MRHSLPTKVGKGRSAPLSPELLINMFAEKAPAGAKSEVVCHGVPGFTLSSDIATDKIRGLYKTQSDGNLYCVIAQTLYSISSTGTASSLGTIGSSGRVFFADSETELCIVAGSQAFTYNSTEGLELITDNDFPGATSVTYLDGYFIFTNRQNGQKDQFFISGLLDGETYDALDFATAERYPDNLVRVYSDHSQLLLFGTDSIEIWFNAGTADFPFARAQGSVIDDGLGAAHSVQKIDESVIWLNHEGIVRRLEGNTPVRISDHAIEHLISKGDWTNAYSWAYTMEGHQFYVLTIPAANNTQTAGTYVYDAATQLWHQRKSYELDYSRIGFHAYAFGKHIVGDVLTGKLYELSLDIYQENGDHLISEMHFPQIQSDGDRFIVHKFQLDMETGQSSSIKYETFNANLVFDSKSLDLSSLLDVPVEYVFDNEGFTLIVAGHFLLDTSKLFEFSLTAAYDISTASFVDSFDLTDFIVGNDESVTGLQFHPNGLEAYVCGVSGSATVYTINFSTAYDVSTASSGGPAYDASSEMDISASLVLSDDGRYLFLLATSPTNLLYQYRLDIPWDVSTASYTGNSLSFAAVDSTAKAFSFDENGFYLTLFGGQNKSMYIYTLTTAWDISTATYAEQSYNFSELGSGISLFGGLVSNASEKIYVSSANAAFTTATLRQYSFESSVVERTLVVEPKAMLRESSDTRTTGFTEPTRSIGKKGEYKKRLIWRRRGQHRTYTPIVRISDPVKRAVFTSYVELERCAG